MKVFKGIVIVDDSNRFDFVRFDDEEEVKFFKEVDFILDYNKYKDMTDDQLENEWRKLVTKSNEIAKKWNEMSEDEREKNINLFQEYENLKYMMNFLKEIYAIKHNKMSMTFPEFVQIP